MRELKGLFSLLDILGLALSTYLGAFYLQNSHFVVVVARTSISVDTKGNKGVIATHDNSVH